ncbi:hypothetical protein CUMW_249140 [Citrus unshiu]|uniref:F-box domain-containing protein n=1 Tax=Citrus unshiu TaxID=55188 RepID=A0A2H5QPD6_CITUN|nr:hypothetical protein CUMW_249140 [Citrus unshiu]
MIQDDNQKEFSPEESKMDSPFAMFAQCISHIISLITPGNASKLLSTYPAFKSVVDSDSVWEKFLPSDYKKIISISSFSTSSLVTSLSKKKLYFHLCYNPILINNNTMSFALDHESGKKCYTVGARGLSITWGSSPQHWKWLSLPAQSACNANKRAGQLACARKRIVSRRANGAHTQRNMSTHKHPRHTGRILRSNS